MSKSHILAGAEAAAWTSAYSASPPLLGGQEAGTGTHRSKDPEADRHFHIDTDVPTCAQPAVRLPQQLWAGSWKLRDTYQPFPMTHTSWNSETRLSLGT